MAAILACLLLTALAPLPARAAGTVAVDVGHGLWDSGAISARGATEFDFNLNLARVLQPVLEARGLTVQPVNFDGEIESLQARVDAAAGSDFLLSIHHDSVASFKLTAWNWMGEDLDFADEDRGFALFISHRNPRLEESLACASAMGRALLSRLSVDQVNTAISIGCFVLTVVFVAIPVVDKVFCCFCFLRRGSYADVVLLQVTRALTFQRRGRNPATFRKRFFA